VFHYASPLLMTYEQELQAATTMLARKSGAADVVSYQAFPDPSKDGGDTILGATITGTRLAQLQSVVHPFMGGYSTVTTVSTQVAA
jgi:hypothetical protein